MQRHGNQELLILTSMLKDISDFCQVENQFFLKKISENLFVKVEGRGIVERIDAKLDARNESRKHIISVAGLKSVQSITDWKKGSMPAADTLFYIADYLQVSVRWLLTGVDDSDLAQDEQDMLSAYNRLSNEGKAAALAAVRGLEAAFPLQSGADGALSKTVK
jgi:transcriptional regulator with XRE-family HTH domain